MGVDLGIAVPAYMAFNFDKYKRDCICDNRIMTTKWMMDQQLSLAKQSCKYLSNGNSGRGRKKKMVCYDKYSNKSRNLSQTINHGWSKYIVDVALRNGCGTIQMEDLSGVTADKDKFLKNWTFYDCSKKLSIKLKRRALRSLESIQSILLKDAVNAVVFAAGIDQIKRRLSAFAVGTHQMQILTLQKILLLLVSKISFLGQR